ncbi:alginate lyase family protein [Pedobacter sp. SYP-B3415]|uniref:alginate lyase family protein n=1 Tax=Pedobacter sp. SYP-B3415 TaxID=2496641 RepID=UPI00101DCE3A|nr:alginate lyase family protein [Pedobacter sp. SYP-B3415]
MTQRSRVCCAAAGFITLVLFAVPAANAQLAGFASEATKLLKKSILKDAEQALKLEPITVTASPAERSGGSIHDFYSEGDYWWPDTENPGGPYVQRDGMTNPANFTAHRRAMIRFSQIIGTLASAYCLTGREIYARHALRHLRAWFTDPETLMNPSLQFAQAIEGRFTGRGIGIIDTIHLMEVARGIEIFAGSSLFTNELNALTGWFRRYLQWLTTHPYGEEEKNAKNNHGTCWVMQVACFARLTKNEAVLQMCRDRFTTVLMPGQMATDGSFPLELKRTKPYGYSLFNLDAMVMCGLLLSDQSHDLWRFKLLDGRNLERAVKFIYPYIKDKNSWPYAKDVMYWNDWPVAQPALIFAAIRFQNARWFSTWKSLEHHPQHEEVIRNLPVRHPILWFDLIPRSDSN